MEWVEWTTYFQDQDTDPCAGCLLWADTLATEIANKETEQADIAAGKVVEMKTPIRYPNIKLRLSTQIRLHDPKKRAKAKAPIVQLHMNEMRDYYGSPLLICQAPLRDQFVDQWRVIWEKKVSDVISRSGSALLQIGLVEWIGKFKESAETKIEPYIPLETRQQMALANFVIETAEVVRRPLEFDQYLVRVCKMKGKKRDRGLRIAR